MNEQPESDAPLAIYTERPDPKLVIRQATEEANALAEVIESRKLYSVIQGKRFVKCEGWTTLACLRGCLPREVSVTEMPEGRYVAEVELIRVSDGMVLTRASSECGGPEDTTWARRAPNARRSMAITRATGKACRVAFSWVMALAGFEPTPLEEMPSDERQELQKDQTQRWLDFFAANPPLVEFNKFCQEHFPAVPAVQVRHMQQRIAAHAKKSGWTWDEHAEQYV